MISRLICVVTSIILVSSCKTAQKPLQTEEAVLTVGDKKFTADDFFQSFTKNQFATDTARRADARQYFDLYTNLKLKVVAAEKQGRDTTEAFREEMASYRKQLAQTYLTDKLLIDNLVAEAYQRLKEEVRVSHILLPIGADASPQDTLAAYRALQALKGRINEGESFADMAQKFSKDLATSAKGGDLGYLSAFYALYPLENAFYNLPVGKVSDIVRTKTGFHLLKTTARRPARGQVRVAHILVRISPGAESNEVNEAKKKIEMVYQKLLEGQPFETLCRTFSDDNSTRSDGGLLRPFGVNRWIPAFEEASFGLAKVGDFSKPFQSNYGWHVVKLVEKIGLQPFAELAPTLKQQVVTDSRGELIAKLTQKKLEKEYKVEVSESVLENLVENADSSLLRGQWKNREKPEVLAKSLFRISDKNYSVADFLQYLAERQEPRAAGSSPSVAMQHYFERYQQKQLLDYADTNLEKKNGEFRALMNEIKDGILLSQLMEENVWGKSLTDSVGQRQFYEKNKDKYKYPERVRATVVVAASDSILAKTQRMMAQKPYRLERKGADLLFEKNSSDLSQRQRDDLTDLVVVLLKYPSYLVEVSGYADATEADSLSDERIRKVVAFLKLNRVPLNKIIEKDYGKFRPNADAALNRRVGFQYFSTDRRDIEKIINSQYPNGVSVSEGIFAKGNSPAVDAAKWAVGYQTFAMDTKKVSVEVYKIEPPRPKTFEEARGAVINDYQKVLENRWLAALRQQIPVKINETELKKITK